MKEEVIVLVKCDTHTHTHTHAHTHTHTHKTKKMAQFRPHSEYHREEPYSKEIIFRVSVQK